MTVKAISAVLGIAAAVAFATPTWAQKKYDPGASDTEIKIGQTAPYSGPVSAAGVIGKTETAYFKMINEKGGVNGRKINFISLDDGYTPPRTVEQARKLVEQESVLFMLHTVGTPTSASIQRYLNQRKIPQLMTGSGSPMWNNPKQYPWTTPFTLSAEIETMIYARYVLESVPNAKVAILYQNDDFGKDYLRGFKKGLGDKAATMIVKEVSYEVTDATIDSQIVTLQASGANVFLDISTPKFGAQSIRKKYDLGWKALHIVTSGTTSINGTLRPAGLDKAQDLVMALVWKSPTDPAWKDDPGMAEYLSFMKQRYPEADPSDAFAIMGYTVAKLTVDMLERCGDDLTRENILKQATSFKDVTAPLALPGIKINNNSQDYNLFHQVQLARFKGEGWVRFGGVVSSGEK